MAAPVRGTQSFVGVMGEVWRRPSLAAMEIAWRWAVGACTLFLVAMAAATDRGSLAHSAPSVLGSANLAALQSMSVFQPVAAAHIIGRIVHAFLVSTVPLLTWLLPSLWLLGNFIAAFGRTLVLLRLDEKLSPRRLAIFFLGTFRSVLLATAWLVWFALVDYAARTAITAPAALGDEPHLVLFSAMLISGTLVLYVAVGIVSWPLYLAPLLAMRNNLGTIDALRAALTSSKALRGKLIEINLVMNIVRITLIVLAMVMSASPLAFQSVATQQFFAIWWSLAVLLYFAASDYFHVVRSAAYLSLHRVYNLQPPS